MSDAPARESQKRGGNAVRNWNDRQLHCLKIEAFTDPLEARRCDTCARSNRRERKLMATAKKKKSTKKRASSEVSWSQTMRKALENKKAPGGFPDQGKPRDSVVRKVKKDAF